mmetsp:Transcript_11249/g.18475  ORF Transcript_11249/g.18475 Transcript_11249/m.18475 type:complete len:99 (-) Transcript_11249:66-362(-)
MPHPIILRVTNTLAVNRAVTAAIIAEKINLTIVENELGRGGNPCLTGSVSRQKLTINVSKLRVKPAAVAMRMLTPTDNPSFSGMLITIIVETTAPEAT